MKVLIDHEGLKYFMTTKKLTPRQARWAEFLSEFNFTVTYQTGKKNDKTNALTKKLHEHPANNKNDWQEHKMQVLLPPKRIDLQPIKVSNQFESKHQEEKQHKKNEKIERKNLKPQTEPRAAKPHAEPHVAPQAEPQTKH